MEHFRYELWMLGAVAQLLQLGAFGAGPVHNALLESFTLHARALLEFFYPKNPKPDDMLANEYVVDPDAWERERGELPDALEPVAKRVGKEVAHLTYGRLDLSEELKQWQVPEIATSLSRLADVFLRHAAPGIFNDVGAASRQPDA